MANKTRSYFNPLSEDSVQCLFFPQSQSNELPIDVLCEKVNSFIQERTKTYLWHRDEFKVHLPIDSAIDVQYLVSNTCFGDNIEDEWFIVHIVIELTMAFTDIIVHLQDNDGDFLLIESANHLPSWISPDTSENRVFIYRGSIHLIPPNIASIEEKLTMKDALNYVVQNTEQTKSSEEIQNAIMSRIGNYPQKLEDSIHNAVVELPIDIAALLQLKPNFISPIVNAYCYHDALDVATFKNVKFKDTATCKVKFTKCMYAMLLHSKLARNVKKIVGNDNKKVLGMKIACGFHMIVSKPSDIESSKEFKLFINNLVKHGYFKNNIEGSKEYKMLLDKAKTYYVSVECPVSTSASNGILEVMKSPEYLTLKESLLSDAPQTELIGDSEDWLNVHPEQLNEMLNNRYGKTSHFKNNDIVSPGSLTNELSKFFNKTSDFEGIQINDSESTDNKIDFDADEFTNCIEKMLKFCTNEKSDSDFDDDSMSCSDDERELDDEVTKKLKGRSELFSKTSILQNIVKSMKEEQASSGPSSNLLQSVGLNKTDFIDSDDD